MDQQGSTPDVNAGANASLPSSADTHATPVAPSQPTPAQNGDLLGNLEHKFESGQTNTGSSADTPPASSGNPSQTETTPTPQAPTQNQGQPQAGDSADDELVNWANSQGLKIETETERQLAKRLRDTQKWAHDRANNNQQFNQIQQALGDDALEDPLEKEVRELRASNARRDFWDSHAEDRNLEGEMIKKVQDMINAGNKTGAQYYSTPQGWSDLLNIVKAEKSTNPTVDQYEAGRQAERENLARVQQAAPVTAAATSSAPPAPSDEDALVAKMSPAEYNEWRKTHNPFAAR